MTNEPLAPLDAEAVTDLSKKMIAAIRACMPDDWGCVFLAARPVMLDGDLQLQIVPVTVGFPQNRLAVAVCKHAAQMMTDHEGEWISAPPEMRN